MSRPSDEEFVEWAANDYNVSKIKNALRIYPELVNVKGGVSLPLSLL